MYGKETGTSQTYQGHWPLSLKYFDSEKKGMAKKTGTAGDRPPGCTEFNTPPKGAMSPVRLAHTRTLPVRGSCWVHVQGAQQVGRLVPEKGFYVAQALARQK